MSKQIANELKVFAKHLRVLVVEDEDELRDSIITMLEMFFATVKGAKDGQEGLDIYKKNKFDLVITDINMPRMNGVELSKQIRILNKEQVIIVLSGYIDKFVIDLIDTGIQSLVLKPYELDKFLQVLLRQCENVFFKQEFEKIKSNKVINKITNRQNKKAVKTPIDDVATKIVAIKSVDEHIDDFKENFVDASLVDDSMWLHLSEDIEDTNGEFEDLIGSIMLNGLTDMHQELMVKLFRKYYGIFELVSGLSDLAYIFADLANAIEDIDINNLSVDAIEAFDILEFFYEDTVNFFRVVFINKETSNLNYLTDSLRSSADQIKAKFGLIELEEDELELF